MTNKTTKQIREHDLHAASEQGGVDARLVAADDTLTRFTVRVTTGAGDQVLKSQRRPARTFTPNAGLRFARDKLQRDEILVELKPRRDGEGTDGK